jgi:hypothetical protein
MARAYRYARTDLLSGDGDTIMRISRTSKTRSIHWITLLGLLSIASFCRAESKCPWLNEATAGGVLNGPATLTVHATEDGGNICVFRSQVGTSVYSLQISVRPIKDESNGIAFYESHCTSPKIALRAIGNEAVLCAANDGSTRGEQVISRVRNDIFIVCVSASEAKDRSMSADLLADRAKIIAEQVAGNLF